MLVKPIVSLTLLISILLPSEHKRHWSKIVRESLIEPSEYLAITSNASNDSCIFSNVAIFFKKFFISSTKTLFKSYL